MPALQLYIRSGHNQLLPVRLFISSRLEEASGPWYAFDCLPHNDGCMTHPDATIHKHGPASLKEEGKQRKKTPKQSRLCQPKGTTSRHVHTENQPANLALGCRMHSSATSHGGVKKPQDPYCRTARQTRGTVGYHTYFRQYSFFCTTAVPACPPVTILSQPHVLAYWPLLCVPMHRLSPGKMKCPG